MLVTIPQLLNPDQVERLYRRLQQADWQAGSATAGPLASQVKDNEQLAQDSALGQELAQEILAALAASPVFMAAALPLKVLPPRFNRYRGGGRYGDHIDRAVFTVPDSPHRIRSDLSATVFLSAPEDYDGGELVIHDSYGEQRVKLPAGDMVLYPGTSLHRVEPVSRGARLASFFWVQSLVREDAQRSLLWQLDGAIGELHGDLDPGHPALAGLTGVYHNLLRRWAQT
ncbi:MAG: Fe2+-dependent dioxygenase [Xanthomonadales bacterium]|nr:Fe2+-dependent dioxygenase [Xanthomonadales bacterium]